MLNVVAAVAIIGVILLALAVMVGKITPGDALFRIVIACLILALAPCFVPVLDSALYAVLKPAALVIVLGLIGVVVVRLLGGLL